MQLTPFFEWGKYFTKKFDLSPYQSILDLGCRQGQLTTYLAKHYPQQQFLAINHDKAEPATTQHALNLDFHNEDLLTLPYHEGFDAIVSFSCLHWIENKQAVLEKVYHTLKPGGKFYLQFFIKHGRPQNDRFFYQTAKQTNWEYYLKNIQTSYFEISIENLCRMLNHVGFMINQFEFVHYPIIFEHSEYLKDWFKTWAPCIQQLPLRKHDHFINDATSTYLNYHHYSQEHAFPYYEYLLEAILEKPLEVGLNLNNYCYQNVSFSLKEAQVLKYFLQGKSAKEIAILLPISSKTVEFHLAKIKEKLNCHKRSEIFQKAMADGFISLMFDNKL